LLALPACSCKDVALWLAEETGDALQDVLRPDPSGAGDGGTDADADPPDGVDDDNDDNNDNNDDDDNDTTYERRIEIVDGGLPGRDGTTISRQADGRPVIAAAKEGRLLIYRVHEASTSIEEIWQTARAPFMVAGESGRLHLAFIDSGAGSRVMYAVWDNDQWTFTAVGAATRNESARVALALDTTSQAHLAFLNDADELVYATNRGGAWSTEIVDDSAVLGVCPSLAVDAAGDVHLAFVRGAALVYALRHGDEWERETLAPYATIDTPRALTFDSTGHPAVVFQSLEPVALQLARQRESGWERSTIELGGNDHRYASLTAGWDGTYHVAYQSVSQMELRYASGDGVNWDITAVVWGEDVGRQTDIQMGTSGKVEVSYHGVEGLGLAVGMWDAWTTEWIDPGGNVGAYAAVAADADGEPHVAYFDQTHRCLKYAARDGPHWSIQFVDDDSNTGYNPSLALDGDGLAHIAYYSNANGNLMYASNALGGWTVQAVDTGGDVGRNPSLAVDEAGAPHIAYYARTGIGLKYATNEGGAWATEFIVSDKDVGLYSSLALDADGAFHVAYADLLGGELWMAIGRGGAWQLETVDTTGEPGRYVDLILDADGGEHLAYLADVGDELRYATRAGVGDAWRIDVVTSAGGPLYPSLAVDGERGVHVIYYDTDRGRVLYAWGRSGAWNQGIIDTVESNSGHASLALDAAGWLHAAYPGPSSLRYTVFPRENP
jgi:hypothetical protein